MVHGKTRIESAIVCQHIDTKDEKMKVRVLTESGKVVDKPVGKLTKR